MPAHRKFTEDVERQMVNMYLFENKSTIDIGKIYYANGNTIYMIFKRRGVKMRGQTAKRTYVVDDHYFDVINTEEKAYFLGILFADGNVRSDHPEISLGLQESDKPLLEKLNRLVHVDRPLLYLNRDKKFPKWKNQWKLYISSQYMKDVVAEYGLIPCKSLIKEFPEVILNSNEDIIRHFIRGYFDGNGSIGIYDQGTHGNKKVTFSISSSLNMCLSLQVIVEKHLNIKSSVYKKHKIGKFAIYDQIKIFAMLDWMYNNASIYLDRKYNIYQDALKIEYAILKR